MGARRAHTWRRREHVGGHVAQAVLGVERRKARLDGHHGRRGVVLRPWRRKGASEHAPSRAALRSTADSGRSRAVQRAASLKALASRCICSQGKERKGRSGGRKLTSAPRAAAARAAAGPRTRRRPPGPRTPAPTCPRAAAPSGHGLHTGAQPPTAAVLRSELWPRAWCLDRHVAQHRARHAAGT